MNKKSTSLIKKIALVAVVLVVLASAFFTTLFSGVLNPILDAVNPAIEWLDSAELTYKFGGVKLTPYKVIKGLTLVIVFVWIAGLVLSLGERYINRITSIHTSHRLLLVKIFQVIVYFIAVMAALNAVGIDLTALAVFSGALGIGIGFGLQKITSNFISGLILLMEQSVRVGDLVQMDNGLEGFVRSTGARHSVLETYDGREVMIPNEDFITSRVINYTYSNTLARVEITVGVAYGSDARLVQKLMLEAATNHPLCSKAKDPFCVLTNFGESALDFVLYFWIDDVNEGRLSPKHDVMLAIMDSFAEHGISIPFPQRDVHLRQVA